MKVYKSRIRVSLSLKGQQVCGDKTLQEKAKKGSTCSRGLKVYFV